MHDTQMRWAGTRRLLRRLGGGNSEREQAVIRVGIGTLLLAYYALVPMHAAGSSRLPQQGTLVLLFLLTVLLLLHVLTHAGDKPWRRLVGALLDVSAVTYFFFASDAAAVPMYALYLWIIFGNGFRFGQRYLYFALGMSLIGFGGAILSLPQWRSHPSLAWGLWVGMLAVSLYVSHLIHRLRSALEVAEAANLAKRRFVSSVSHELRTPLNAIIGMGTLFRMTQLDQDQQEMLASLEDASRLMLSLIEDVLDFSKIEAGKISLEVVQFEVENLMESVTGLLRYQALGKGLKLDCTLAPGTPRAVMGDPHHLKQILVNLMSNAIKFTHSGEVGCKVSLLRADAHCNWLRFEVSDTGIGIAQSAQARIFESFAQADDSTTRNYGGTGLGTTIAKQLVEMMGGRIGVTSTLGKGSLFWFELPFECVRETAARNRGALHSVPSAAGGVARSLRVLVAEDNYTNARLLERVLERSGHSFEVVPDGEQALDRLANSDFDIALFDMNMPVLSGLDAIKAYRFMVPRAKRIPIAMFSADATVDTREECLRGGADAYLVKPIQIDELFNTMADLTGIPCQGWSESASAAGARSQQSVAPTPASEADISSPLDLSALKDLEALGGNPKFVRGLIQGYIEDTRQLVQRLESGIERQRLQECREVLHAMKGSAVSIGAIGMRRFCEETEKMDPQDLFRLRSSIMERCKALCSELEKWYFQNETRTENSGNSRAGAQGAGMPAVRREDARWVRKP